MIAETITLLQSHHFKGAGKYTEIAKGKNELGNELRKIKRWLLRKL
jgi:hypothetical protein